MQLILKDNISWKFLIELTQINIALPQINIDLPKI